MRIASASLTVSCLAVVSSCHPDVRPDVAEWADRTSDRILAYCMTLPSVSEESSIHISMLMEDLVLEGVNRFGPEGLIKLARKLRSDQRDWPYPKVLACEALPNGRDFLLIYSVWTGMAVGSSNVRIVKRMNSGFDLLKPSTDEVRSLEAELSLWRGADAALRYGDEFHPDAVRIEERLDGVTWTAWESPEEIRKGASDYYFMLEYGQPSTLQGSFKLLWKYDGSKLSPTAYSWSGHMESVVGHWQRVGGISIASLTEDILRLCEAERER